MKNWVVLLEKSIWIIFLFILIFLSFISAFVYSLVVAIEGVISSQYELSRSLVNDQKKQMIFKLWQRIFVKYEIKSKSFSTHQSEIDDQTKNIKKVMKNYLWAYVCYAQDDWMDFLSNVEFVANNHENASTKITSFFAKLKYHPRSEVKPLKSYDKTENRKAKFMRVEKITKRREAMKKYRIERITTTQDDQEKHANANCQSHFEYKVGDMMYINVKDFTTKRQSRSLSSKNVESWKILKNINNKAYELNISEHLRKIKLTSIFHSWKVHLAPFDSFSSQVLTLDPSLLITSADSDKQHKEWKLLEIVDCRKTRKDVEYKATYVGPYDEWNTNPPWQTWMDFMNSKHSIMEFG